MLIRLVRMTFRPDRLADFLRLFDETAPHIRAAPGCLHLELWQDLRYSNILTTHSHWASEEDLEAYRDSALFRATWARTRPLFAAPPQAFSHVVARAAISAASGV
ncbi:MAG: antibiotic biosynthesis monooxygenase [Bacteroidetes bacterium]|nr:MAG: antibiotic biosynthesis monooxygenase [Bacteroidota bacterium]